MEVAHCDMNEVSLWEFVLQKEQKIVILKGITLHGHFQRQF